MSSNSLFSQGEAEYEKKTTELCQLFSDTLHSLSADAAAIRQLTNLAILCNIPMEKMTTTTNTTTSTTNMMENIHPNHAFHSQHHHCHSHPTVLRNNYTTNPFDDDDDDYDDDDYDDDACRDPYKTTSTNNNHNGHRVTRVQPSNPSLEGLRALDAAVTSIEKKVEALREIVTEEKRSLDAFETTLSKEVQNQQSTLEHWIQACQDQDQQDEEDEQEEEQQQQQQQQQQQRQQTDNNNGEYQGSDRNTTTRRTGRNHMERRRRQQQQQHEEEIDSSSQSGISRQSSGRNTRRDSVDPRSHNDNNNNNQDDHYDTLPTTISLARVTEHELQTISRNTRGRLTTVSLNEALEEIELVWHDKALSLPHIRYQTTDPRLYDYLKQQRSLSTHAVDEQVDAHSGRPWVSEQELRETCAFFRFGESTARATLAVLCSLKRLKQVPGKHMGVTYICLSESDERK